MNRVFVEAADRFILPRFRNMNREDVIHGGQFEKIVTQADRESSNWILDHCRKQQSGLADSSIVKVHRE